MSKLWAPKPIVAPVLGTSSSISISACGLIQLKTGAEGLRPKNVNGPGGPLELKCYQLSDVSRFHFIHSRFQLCLSPEGRRTSVASAIVRRWPHPPANCKLRSPSSPS